MRPAPFCLAGILNITPDSFATGTGALPPVEETVARGLALLADLDFTGGGMLDQTAVGGMLDLGAESTRPGAPFVPAEDEAARLFPVLQGILAARPDALCSIDTTRADIAEKALNMGAVIINDVSACNRDARLTEVLATYKPGYVLTHGGGVGGRSGAENLPHHRLIETVERFFEQELTRLTAAGLPEDRIVLDPGIGFGKTPEQSWKILRELPRLHGLGRPLYVGLSMKLFFRILAGITEERHRKIATQTAVALLVANGVRYHRVHHVKDCAIALRVAHTMLSIQE